MERTPFSAPSVGVVLMINSPVHTFGHVRSIAVGLPRGRAHTHSTRMRRSKIDDDEVRAVKAAGQPELSRTSKQRQRLVVGGCAIFSLLLCFWLVADAELGRADSTLPRRPLSERAVDALDELAAVVVHQPARHIPPPCAVNLTGFACPNGHGSDINTLFMLDPASGSGSQPSYRSANGVWLVHSPRSCLSHPAWILSRSKPDESTTAEGGACDIEAHILGTRLPVGALDWAYVSCGEAGGAHPGNRLLTLQLVQKCDCPTAGEASDTDAAAGAHLLET